MEKATTQLPAVVLDTPELRLIPTSKAQQIKDTFEPMAQMLLEFEDRYNKLMAIPTSEITPDLCKEYKRFRLDVAKVRIETGKAKDNAKKDLKLEDKAIMGVHNILVYAVNGMEERALEREKFFEIQEEKRLKALQNERVLLLSSYVDDADQRDLSKFKQDEFDALLMMKQKEFADRIEAERIAEERRIAKEKEEQAERERIRLENEKLRKEASEKEKLLQLEREKIRKERELIEQESKKKKEESERLIAIEKQKDKIARDRQQAMFDIDIKMDFQVCRSMEQEEWNRLYSRSVEVFEAEKLKSKPVPETKNDDNPFRELWDEETNFMCFIAELEALCFKYENLFNDEHGVKILKRLKEITSEIKLKGNN